VRELFFDAYRRDAEMARVDVVICSHPAANCELYMPLNKTLIVYASTRLEFGRHDDVVEWRQPYLDSKSPARIARWIENLRRIASVPGNVIASNNMYDAKYIEYFTGIKAQYLPSWCGSKNIYYKPSKPQILAGPYRDNLGHPKHTEEEAWQHPIFKALKTALDSHGACKSNLTLTSGATFCNGEKGYEVQRMKQMYPKSYEYSDLAAHPAIIIIPYQVNVLPLGIPNSILTSCSTLSSSQHSVDALQTI